jgi:hypothetical protein
MGDDHNINSANGKAEDAESWLLILEAIWKLRLPGTVIVHRLGWFTAPRRWREVSGTADYYARQTRLQHGFYPALTA